MQPQTPDQPEDPPGQYPETDIRIVYWRDWEAIAREERAQERRQIVNDIFSDKVMAFLALLLVPVLLLLDFAKLSPDVFMVLTIVDTAIWAFFILEYACRLFVAEDRLRFFLSPFGLFDLVIIGAPALALALGAGYRVASYLRILRVAQVFQILRIGGTSVHKRISRQQPVVNSTPPPALTLRTLPLTPAQGGTWTEVPLDETTPGGIQVGTWRDFSSWTSKDLQELSRYSGLPLYVLQEKLWERTYPRGETIGSQVLVFLKIPRITREQSDNRKWRVTWDGLLVVYNKDGVMTFSRSRIPVLDTMPSIAMTEGTALSGPVIVSGIVLDSLRTAEDLFSNAEVQINNLEALPLNRLPSNFTAMMYSDQKVLDRIQSWLHHTKTALEQIGGMEHQDPSPGSERLQSAISRYASALDTAETISGSFSRMVDFYLNMTSLSMNQVMKYLAVLTALTLIPALVGGLLGMNLAGNPWPVTLLPMITFVALFMLVTAWIYFNIGWLKR